MSLFYIYYKYSSSQTRPVNSLSKNLTSNLKLPLFCNGGGFLSVKDVFSETGYPAFYR